MQVLTADQIALDLHKRLNDTRVPYPDQHSISGIFENRVAEFPEAVAVSFRDHALTYTELNRRANCLAAAMSARGLRPGAVVGIAMDRTPALIAALLACLKCGAAYLPFDATWPRCRVDELLRAARCRFVLHDDRDGWLGCDGITTMLAEPELLSGDPGNPRPAAGPDSTAYINFTSGSTGQPKGVPIRHRSIARLVFGARYAKLDEHTVLLQLAPVTFDAATFEIWGALLHGGRCVLYPARLLRFIELGRTLKEQKVNTVFLTTALFNAIVDQAPGSLDNVGTILTGGESVSRRHIGEAVRRYGADRLVHVYGPTEATTFATYFPLSEFLPGRPDVQDGRVLPIGRPIQNTRVYVVTDGHLNGPGETGEIWLAGPGLSRGYLGGGAADGSEFVECLIGDRAERVYRTGDRGYWLPSGDLVFVGRDDDQVKVSGHRIELGEISLRLGEHPHVLQSYVTTCTRESGEKILLAFVVPASDSLSAVDLRAHLRASLPAYMIPHEFCFRESLPLSATGKVDRRALLMAHQDQARPAAAMPE